MHGDTFSNYIVVLGYLRKLKFVVKHKIKNEQFHRCCTDCGSIICSCNYNCIFISIDRMYNNRSVFYGLYEHEN